MKVAVLLSGFPRNFKYTFPYFKKYIADDLHPDVFYFGYNDLKYGSSTDDILSRYKPKKHLIREPSSEIDEEIWNAYGTRAINSISLNATEGPQTQPHWILSQYYNLYKTNELKREFEQEGNFKYDCVIRARPDYFFYTNVKKEDLLKIKSDHVYIPDVWDFAKLYFYPTLGIDMLVHGIGDQFAYGDSEAMDKYCSLFYKIQQYNLEQGCPFHPETLLKFHITEGEKLRREVIKNPFWFELSDFEVNGVASSYIDGDDPENTPNRRQFT